MSLLGYPGGTYGSNGHFLSVKWRFGRVVSFLLGLRGRQTTLRSGIWSPGLVVASRTKIPFDGPSRHIGSRRIVYFLFQIHSHLEMCGAIIFNKKKSSICLSAVIINRSVAKRSHDN